MSILNFEEYKQKFGSNLAKLFFEYDGPMSKAEFLNDCYMQYKQMALEANISRGQQIDEVFNATLEKVTSISPIISATKAFVTVNVTFTLTDGRTVEGLCKLKTEQLSKR